MTLSYLLALLIVPNAAIVIEIFSDPACTISVGNSSIYTGFANICNTATTPDSGLSIGIDLCTPQRVAMSVYRAFSPGESFNEFWADSFTCTGAADTSFEVQLNVCTAVQPCSTCPQQFFRLLDTQCDAPAPVFLFQQDRGLTTSNQAQACQQINPEGPTAGFNGRFQTREVLSGICSFRTITDSFTNVFNNNNTAAMIFLIALATILIPSHCWQPLGRPAFPLLPMLAMAVAECRS
jgi:hypothetical protein